MIDVGAKGWSATRRRARRGPESALGFETRQPRGHSGGHWGAAFAGGGELRLRGEGRASESGRAERCASCNLRRWPGRGALRKSGGFKSASGSGPCHCQVPGAAPFAASLVFACVLVCVCRPLYALHEALVGLLSSSGRTQVRHHPPISLTLALSERNVRKLPCGRAHQPFEPQLTHHLVLVSLTRTFIWN